MKKKHKPIKSKDNMSYKCPKCGADVGYIDDLAVEIYERCLDCGLKINWNKILKKCNCKLDMFVAVDKSF